MPTIQPVTVTCSQPRCHNRIRIEVIDKTAGIGELASNGWKVRQETYELKTYCPTHAYRA